MLRFNDEGEHSIDSNSDGRERYFMDRTDDEEWL